MKLKTVIKKLEKNNIDFYITGSYAVEYYTGRRYPSDIDFAVNSENLGKIARIFKDKCVSSRRKIKNDIFNRVKVKDFFEFGSFDRFQNGLNQTPSNSLLKRCNFKMIDGYKCKIISVEDLIILKLSLDRNGGTKFDREDIKLLLRSQKVSFWKIALGALSISRLSLFLNLYKTRYSHNIDNIKVFNT